VSSQRELRAARNEHLFRRLNERLHTLAAIGRTPTAVATSDGPEPFERFVCECAQKSCSRVVELTADEYTAVRAGNRRFLVYPDDSHTSPELEEVVERTDRYWVVHKLGEAGEVADLLVERRSDPL
jgi:hypothetical protein